MNALVLSGAATHKVFENLVCAVEGSKRASQKDLQGSKSAQLTWGSGFVPAQAAADGNTRFPSSLHYNSSPKPCLCL